MFIFLHFSKETTIFLFVNDQALHLETFRVPFYASTTFFCNIFYDSEVMSMYKTLVTLHFAVRVDHIRIKFAHAYAIHEEINSLSNDKNKKKTQRAKRQQI